MKAKIKIPRRAVDSKPSGGITMFSHIEYDVEGTTSEIEDIYQSVMHDTDGLNAKDWAQLRDEYEMNGGEMTPDMQDMYVKCNGIQRHVLNQMKLAKRNTKHYDK